MHDTRFRKSSTKENDNNMGFDFQTGIFEDVTDDEVERNDIPMDVNIDMEASRNLQLAEKHMTKELKDDYSIDDQLLILPSCLVPQLCRASFQYMSYLTIYLLPFLSEDVRLKSLISYSTLLQIPPRERN